MRQQLDGLQRLREDVERTATRTGLDAEIRQALADDLETADDLAYLVLNQNGFLNYLSRRLSREHTRYNHPDRLDDGDEEVSERSQPLCLCHDRYCPLKEGRLPRKVREGDDPRQALRRYTHNHPSEPLVLQDIQEEFRDKVVRCWKVHRRVLNCVQNNTHPDDLGDEAEDTDDGDEAEGSEPSEGSESPATAGSADD